jgi:hypothetical protein
VDFSPLAGRGKRGYIVSIHAAMIHDYAPLTANFERVIERSQRRAAFANVRHGSAPQQGHRRS